MISEERLKELLKEETTIYRANGYIEEIYLTENDFEVTDKELVFNYKIYAVLLEDLFETYEEAREYQKYGNVTRTEKLELPMWKDVERAIKEDAYIDFRFETYNNNLYSLEVLPYNNIVRICDESICLFFQELTRENYHKALDLCVKLFKGEE